MATSSKAKLVREKVRAHREWLRAQARADQALIEAISDRGYGRRVANRQVSGFNTSSNDEVLKKTRFSEARRDLDCLGRRQLHGQTASRRDRARRKFRRHRLDHHLRLHHRPDRRTSVSPRGGARRAQWLALPMLTDGGQDHHRSPGEAGRAGWAARRTRSFSVGSSNR